MSSLAKPVPQPRTKPQLKVLGAESDSRRPHYRLDDVGALHQLGRPFVADFERGIRSFAISSTNYKSSQQRICLALAAYFDHLFDVRIAVVSDSLQRGCFSDLVRASAVSPHVSGVEVARFYHHFDFIDLKKLLSLEQPLTEAIVADYDLIFWDLPVLGVQKGVDAVFNRFSGYVQSLSLVVAPSAARSRDQEELEKHFEGYGINVSGVQFKELLWGQG